MSARPFKFVAAFFLIAFGALQFIPVNRSNPPVVAAFQGPPDVQQVLRRSCYDCHSNETRWPWYSRIAPVSWMVAKHVREGREHLNFSDWQGGEEVGEVAQEVWEEVESGRMPLRSYLLAHPDARLGPQEREVLQSWAAQRPGGTDTEGAQSPGTPSPRGKREEKEEREQRERREGHEEHGEREQHRGY